MIICKLALKGDVVICMWSIREYFTTGREYLLHDGLIANDDSKIIVDDHGNPLLYTGRFVHEEDYCTFELKKPLEVKEEFDIDNYKPYWVDRISKQSDGNVTLHSQHSGFTLNKQDAIAIAKHFKLTGEDL